MALRIDIAKLGTDFEPQWFEFEIDGRIVRMKQRYLLDRDTRAKDHRSADVLGSDVREDVHPLDIPSMRDHWLSSIVEVHEDDVEVEGGPSVDNPHVQRWFRYLWDTSSNFAMKVFSNCNTISNFQDDASPAPAGASSVDQGAD